MTDESNNNSGKRALVATVSIAVSLSGYYCGWKLLKYVEEQLRETRGDVTQFRVPDEGKDLSEIEKILQQGQKTAIQHAEKEEVTTSKSR